MSSQDETSECIYITTQCSNPSQTNGNSIYCNIDLQTNPIVGDLSDYNIYLQNLTVTTSELPYCNVYRNLQQPTNPAFTNIMNYSITLFDSSGGTPFNLGAGPYPENIIPVGAFNLAGTSYQGVTIFLTYISENLPNSNGRSYYNVHSINQFMGFINNALNLILTAWENANVPVNSMYFAFDPISQFYNFYCPDAFKISTVNLYVNAFLNRVLDGFRWIYNGVPYNIGDADYTGMDYQLVKANYPFNKNTDNVWTYQTEYSCLANLIDVHSVLITTNSGSLQNVRQQIVPAAFPTNNNNTSLNLPTIAALKNLDINFGSLQLSSINNCYIQFESTLCAYPINSLSNGPLNNISIQLFIQDIDNVVHPMSIPAGSGFANVKFVLKKKVKPEAKNKK